MKTAGSTAQHTVFLDAIRGLAAVLVALGHARLMLLRDASEASGGLNPLQKAFYLTTTFGDIAVMVFFVLSGYLVGGSVVRSLSSGRWSWRTYALARVSRLYTVLIPIVAVGIVLDLIGSRYLGWTSPYSVPHYGFMMPESIAGDISLPIVLGNMFFLQKIFVTTVGSNHPLWSLTNEAWYYVLFPLIAVICLERAAIMKKAGMAILFLAILFFLPREISSLFVVWLMGVAVAALPDKYRMPLWAAIGSTVLLIGFMVSLSANIIHTQASGYIIGALFSTMLYCWLSRTTGVAHPRIADIAAYFSNISYTFYLAHTPFMVFAAALLVKDGGRFAPDLRGCMLVVGLLVASIAYSTVLWFLFERNTPLVRRFLGRPRTAIA